MQRWLIPRSGAGLCFVCVDWRVSRRKKREGGGFQSHLCLIIYGSIIQPISFVYSTSRGVRLALGKGNELGIVANLPNSPRHPC